MGTMLVAGCADAPPAELRTGSSLQTTPPQTAAVEAPTRPVTPAHKPPVPAPEGASPAAADAAQGSEADASQGVDRLVGLGEGDLQNVLGPPMLQEDRAPTKLWVFRDRNCTINVTLYPDVQTRQFHALSYEVISDVHTAERTRQCVAEFSSRFSQR